MAESYPCPKCGHPVEHTHGAIGRPPWCFCRACGTMFNPEHTNTQPLDLTGPAPAEPVQEDTVTEPTETPAAEAKAPREVKHRPDPNTPFTDDDLTKLPNWAQGKVKTLNAQLVHALEQLAHTNPSPEGHPAPAPGDVYVVFDGPPSHESGRFVECEDAEGHGINAGEWVERPNGWWALRIPRGPKAGDVILTPGEHAAAVTGEARPAEGDTPPLGLTVSEDGDLLNWEGENYVRQSELVAVRFAAGARLARIAELVNEGLEELLPELEDDNDE